MTALLSSFRLMLILCFRSIGIVSPNGYDVCIIVKFVNGKLEMKMWNIVEMADIEVH